MICLLLLLFGYCYGLSCDNNPYFEDAGPLVKTSTGSIMGKYEKVFQTNVAAFLGIPYVEPPLGDRRFANAIPVKPWTEIFDGTKKHTSCMQYSSRNFSWIPTSKPSEDCLHINVWTPLKCCCSSPLRLPVLVWIYGGGFYSGSSDMDLYDGSTIASYGNAIVVSFNYRLGVFGFLNSGDGVAPGNQGLYDQYLALKWIKNNIEYFGGDPNSITLVGESAGAMSISLHLISPLSRNLFHRAIMQSSTSYQPLMVDIPLVSNDKVNAFSKLVGCASDVVTIETEPENIVKCLKEKDAFELAKAEDFFTSKNPAYFVPTIGNDFLPVSPIEAFQSGKFSQVEVLMGNNQNEGTIFLNYFMPDIFPLDQNPTLNLEAAEMVVKGIFQTVPNLPSSEIFKFYFQNVTGDDSEAIARVIADLVGDFSFSCPVMFLAEKIQDVYVYWFNHRSVRDPTADWVGVPHFYDVQYVFGVPIHDADQFTPEDERFSGDLIQKWVSFAKLGYPLGDVEEKSWPKFTPEQPTAYELNPRSRKNLPFPRATACEFWRPLFSPKTEQRPEEEF